jgi:hypothetical protein
MNKKILPVHHSAQVCVGECFFDIGDESLVADSWRTVVVEVINIGDFFLDLYGCECGLSGTKTVACDNYFSVGVVGCQHVGTSQEVICDILVDVVEALVDFAAIAPVGLHNKICILGPILVIIRTPNGHNDSIVIGIVATVTLGCIGVVVENLQFLHVGMHQTRWACPKLQLCLIAVRRSGVRKDFFSQLDVQGGSLGGQNY